MQITEHCDHLEIIFDNSVQAFGVKQRFAVAHPQAWHIRQRNPHMEEWDGQIHFCKPIKKGSNIFTLPVGFKASLIGFLNDENLAYKFSSIVDATEIPFDQHLLHLEGEGGQLTLDETQKPACQALLASRRAVIELGTASGKTEIFINAFACLREVFPDLRCAIIVPKKNLLTQTVERIHNRLKNIKVGIVGGGKFQIDAPITVATAQTACGHDKLVKATEIRQWLSTVNCLILDEAHHSALSTQWQDIIAYCAPRWLWAVSAKVTFFNAKNKVKEMSLEGLFGKPAFQGFSKERTCPVTAVFHYHPAWKGKFNDQGLHGNFTDMLPCSYRLAKGQPWQSGFWRGPDNMGCVNEEWLKKPNPKDILGSDPETNLPVYRSKALIADPDDPTKRIYNPERMVPDKERFGVYTQDAAGWHKVATNNRHVVYFTRHDVAIMEFRERNAWAIGLAVAFTERKQAWAISTKRNRHAFKILAMLRKAGIEAHILHGDLTGDEQRDVISDVREARVPGLVGHHSILSEGMDLPRLIHLIKLDGISEEQVLEQQKGRVQRVFEGKKMGFIHIPRDLQEENLNKVNGQMVTYFRHRQIPIKKLVIE